MDNHNKPEITKVGALSIQVCVPKDYSDEEVLRFAEMNNPCGTTNGWQIRRQGDYLLDGAQERTRCSERENFVHIMLDA